MPSSQPSKKSLPPQPDQQVSPQRPVTMRDVARLAGVSQSTVSRVLSDAASSIPISEETYRKVYDAVQQLGYYPNVTARSLRRQRTEMIAIMIADISNPFYHSMVRAVQDEARHHQYDVLIASTDHLHENEIHFCEAMMRRPVDGIIIVPYHLATADIEQLMTRTGAKIVVLGDDVLLPTVDALHNDDERATYEAVRWLIDVKGHRRIGFVDVPEARPGARRKRGYQRALSDAGIALDPAYIHAGDWSVESGEDAAAALLALPDPPTAIFACNDHMAIGVLNEALDQDLRIPEDLAIVGFDNIPATTLVRPRLTTVAQYPVEIGALLARALFERIEGVYADERRVFASRLELIERETT